MPPFRLSAYLCLILSGFPVLSFAQGHGACREAANILQVIKTYHLAPQPIDDFSAQDIYNRWTRQLDPAGLYFTDSVLALPDLRPAVLSQALKNADCAFLSTMTRVYAQQLARGEHWVQYWQRQGLDYTEEDVLRFGPKSAAPTYAANDTALADRWERWLKYQVLDALDTQKGEAGTALANLMDQEPETREIVVSRAQCRIQRRANPNQGLAAYVAEKFLEALALQYDPHTMYFSPSLKAAFEQSLATEGYTFGFEVDEDDQGEIEIAALSPGGPAWKSNEINVGDRLIGIETLSGPGIDLFCATSWELRRYLNTEAPNEITLRIRKSNGREQTVSLFKEKMAVEENIITSFVLDGPRKVGYIYLPGFYTHWEGYNALGCANDLAKELLKLRLEGIKGLILDLRNNGGGSMQEALGLAGIFVDEGTLILERQAGADIRLLKDQNRGTIYDDPLIVMVNGMSASASEIVAAILQDYHRAVIVGDTTYGKSTGQIIMPINTLNPEGGFIKTTVSQYFRLQGPSHQQVGVVPDVVLPEVLEPLIPRESDDKEAIPADTISKAVRYTPLAPLPLADLATQSQQRIAASPAFQQVWTQQRALRAYQKEQQEIRLQPAHFSSRQIPGLLLNDSSLNASTAHSYQVQNTRFSEVWISVDEQRRTLNAAERKQILGDMYIEEAFQIMLDLIAAQTP